MHVIPGCSTSIKHAAAPLLVVKNARKTNCRCAKSMSLARPQKTRQSKHISTTLSMRRKHRCRPSSVITADRDSMRTIVNSTGINGDHETNRQTKGMQTCMEAVPRQRSVVRCDIDTARIVCGMQGLRNGTVSVRPSVCLSHLSIAAGRARRVCCCGPGGREMSIDRGGRPPSTAAARRSASNASLRESRRQQS